MRRVVTVVAVLAVAVLAGASAAAQDAPRSAPPKPETPPAAVAYPYEFGSSSVPMLRNAAWFSALGSLADRGASEVLGRATHGLLQERGWKGVVARLSRLYLLDMPLASLTQVFNHEYGHITRDVWLETHSVRIDGWPWPVPFASPRVRGTLRSDSAIGPPASNSIEWLTAVAGGSEASGVMADMLMDRVYRAGLASQFDIVLYVYAKLDPSAYAIVRGDWEPGDPAQFAQTLAVLRGFQGRWQESDSEMLRSIRAGAWLNLLDYALVGNVERVIVDDIVHGQTFIRPAWIRVGPVRIVPGFNYTPTPRGQQYRFGSRVRTRHLAGSAYVRWTQRLQADEVPAMVQQYNDHVRAVNATRPPTRQYPLATVQPVWRLFGVGGDVAWTRRPALVPSLSTDVWRDIDGRVAARAELGVTYHHRAFGEGQAIKFAVGGKGAGYVQGFPERPGAYVTAGVLARF